MGGGNGLASGNPAYFLLLLLLLSLLSSFFLHSTLVSLFYIVFFFYLLLTHLSRSYLPLPIHRSADFTAARGWRVRYLCPWVRGWGCLSRSWMYGWMGAGIEESLHGHWERTGLGRWVAGWVNRFPSDRHQRRRRQRRWIGVGVGVELSGVPGPSCLCYLGGLYLHKGVPRTDNVYSIMAKAGLICVVPI